MPKKKKFNIDPEKIMDLLTIKGNSPHTFSDPEISAPIEKVVIPKGGGIDIYLRGQKYPYPGYPDYRKLEISDIVKRTSLMWIQFFKSLPKFKIILLMKNIKKFVSRWLTFFTWILGNHRLKPRFYSRPVREIYRLFDILIERSDQSQKDKFIPIRDAVCMVLEFDNAYRFMLQDVIAEMNIDEIKMDKRDLFYASKYDIRGNKYDFGGKRTKQNKIIKK